MSRITSTFCSLLLSSNRKISKLSLFGGSISMVMKVVPYYDFFKPGGPAVVEFKNINTATNPYQKLFDLDPCPGALRCARAADSEISDGHPKKKDEKYEGEGRNKAAPERIQQSLGERAQLDASAEYQRDLVALMAKQFFR